MKTLECLLTYGDIPPGRPCHPCVQGFRETNTHLSTHERKYAPAIHVTPRIFVSQTCHFRFPERLLIFAHNLLVAFDLLFHCDRQRISN